MTEQLGLFQTLIPDASYDGLWVKIIHVKTGSTVTGIYRHIDGTKDFCLHSKQIGEVRITNRFNWFVIDKWEDKENGQTKG